MKKIAITAAILGSTALAIGVWAQNPGKPEQGGPGQPGGMREQMMERMRQRGGPMMQQMMQRGGMMQGMQHGPMQGGPGHEGPGGAEQGEILKHVLGNPELAKKAGITEDQIKKIKDGQFNFEKSMITMRADAEVAKLEVKHLAEAAKVDRGALEKAIDAAGAKEIAVRKAGMMRMLDVKESLGAETIEKIKGMVREHMLQRMKQAQQGPGGMPGNERPWLRGQDGNKPMNAMPPQRDGQRPEGRGGERGDK